MEYNKCIECNEKKSYLNFTRDKKGFLDINGEKRRSKCKVCCKKQIRNYLSTLKGFLKNLIKESKKRAKKKKLNYDLDYNYLEELWKKQNGKCNLSGMTMTHINNYGLKKKISRCCPTNVSIDRINSKKGYIKENSQLICTWIQSAKNDYEQELFLNWIKITCEYQKKFITCGVRQ